MPAWLPDADAHQRRLVGRAGRVFGIDLDLPSLRQNRAVEARVLAGTDRLPFTDDAFDLVTANMVVEHLDQPRVTLDQIARVLRPGGVFLYHTPNYNNPITRAAAFVPQGLKNRVVKFLEGRDEDDVFPTRYRMNTPDAVQRYAEEAGMRVDCLDLFDVVGGDVDAWGRWLSRRCC